MAKAERAQTFGDVAQRFLADCDHMRLRSVRNIESALRPIISEWQDRPLASIRRRDAIELADAIKLQRGPGAATKAQAWTKRLFNWSVEKAVLEASPLAGMKAVAQIRVRDRALSDDEVRRLWRRATSGRTLSAGTSSCCC